MNCVIYSLNCPITRTPKYVGQTTNPKKRLLDHLKSKKNSPKYGWIKSLTDQGLRPEMEIIMECERNELNFWEMYYIALYKSWGFVLKNLTAGGDSPIVCYGTSEKRRVAQLGKKASPEARLKMSLARKGIKKTEEHKNKIRESHKKRPFTDERRENLKLATLACIGRKKSPEEIEKIASKNRGKKRSDESKLKQSLAKLGKPKTEQAKLNMSISAKKRIKDEVERNGFAVRGFITYKKELVSE